jgi:hypothetical protein
MPQNPIGNHIKHGTASFASKGYVDLAGGGGGGAPGGAYLPLAGGTLTGNLIIPNPSALWLNAAQTRGLYIDASGYSHLDASYQYLTNTATICQGTLNIQPLTGNAQISFSPPAGGDSRLILQGPINSTITMAGANAGGVNSIISRAANLSYSRWVMNLKDNSAETGANAGSNFSIQNFSDGGALLGTPFSIERATGAVNLTGSLNFNSVYTISEAGNNFTIDGPGAAGVLTIQGAGQVVARGSQLWVKDDVGAGANAGCGISMLSTPPGGATRACNIQGYLTDTWAGWLIGMPDSTPRTGANAGANFSIQSYDDAGNHLAFPLIIDRATGVVNFSASPTINKTVADPFVTNIGSAIIGQKNGINRIGLNIGDTTLETATNRGSDFSIDGYDNAGNLIGRLLTIDRRGASFLSDSQSFSLRDRIGPVAGAGTNLNLTSMATGAAPVIRIGGWFEDTGAGWNILLPNSNPRTGGNAGANFEIYGQNDTGARMVSALIINRATGVVDFSVPPTVAGAAFPFLPLSGGTMTGQLTINQASAANMLTVQTTTGGAFLSLKSTTSGNTAILMDSSTTSSSAQIQARVGGAHRWHLRLNDGSVETGADSGSNFAIAPIGDGGANLPLALTITRATRVVNFSVPPTVADIPLIQEAPNDGQMYVRQSGAWVAVVIP